MVIFLISDALLSLRLFRVSLASLKQSELSLIPKPAYLSGLPAQAIDPSTGLPVGGYVVCRSARSAKRLIGFFSRVGAEDRIAFSNILSSMHDCQTQTTARSRTLG